MRQALLGLILLGCAAHTPAPSTGRGVLFCPAPESAPAEFDCGYYTDSSTGVVGRRLCPRGYIHQPSSSTICRRKDMPLDKVQPVWRSN